MKIRPFTRKNTLLVLCAFALIGYSIFSFSVISRLKAETTGLTDSYAALIQQTVSGTMSHEEILSALQRIITKATNPIIVTDSLWNPLLWNNLDSESVDKKGVAPLSGNHTAYNNKFITRKIAAMRKSFTPRPIYANPEQKIIFGYLVYGNSLLIRSLFIMPFLEISLGAAFIALLYLAFHNIRVTERSNLWIGLAKETAHQLGTPISSIMGWVEYMRTVIDTDKKFNTAEAHQIMNNMDNDLGRLTKITARFSQIGSFPSMVPCDLRLILTDVSSYFQLRLPLLRKRISIEYDFNQLPLVDANKDLLEWVFENMLKNSIDAITRDDGQIKIKTEHLVADGIIRIQLTDNGRGVSWESQKKVFTPGYTTKRRGWGLGLTLAKRIVEDYHKGEIYIKWSQRDKGTTFNVDLPVSSGPAGKRHPYEENSV